MTNKKLISQIKALKNSKVKDQIDKKLKEFKSFKRKSTDEWFCELCFCILTANSKAMTALSIQEELGSQGFICNSQKEICNCIKRNKHRFHNNKSKYIIEARKHKDELKKKINSMSEKDGREWIVKNIKGLGYKESSHFLRNVGYDNLAILDRHILNLMVDTNMIKEKPKTLTKNIYEKIEKKFIELAKKMKMSAAELDFYMWYIKTNKVLK